MTNDELKANYPNVYKDLECGPGWNALIGEVFAIAESHLSKMPGFKFAQIKEKFGGLRMYFDEGDDYIAGAVRLAESVSFRTCEVTGKPGRLFKRGGWVRTLCDEQAELDGFTPVKGG